MLFIADTENVVLELVSEMEIWYCCISNNWVCFSCYSGIAGLQWKKHNGKKIAVTLNELDPDVCSTIKENCKQNVFSCGSLEDSEKDAQFVEVTNMDANVILHQRQYHFM